VPLHGLVLLGGERAAFAENRIGNADLADIVERRAVPHVSLLIFVLTEQLREQRGQVPDPLQVLPGPLIAEVRDTAEQVQRLDLALDRELT
jgi:hypothetical protein